MTEEDMYVIDAVGDTSHLRDLYIIATCPSGCVVGWSGPSVPSRYVEQFVDEARRLGYRLKPRVGPPERVVVECGH